MPRMVKAEDGKSLQVSMLELGDSTLLLVQLVWLMGMKG